MTTSNGATAPAAPTPTSTSATTRSSSRPSATASTWSRSTATRSAGRTWSFPQGGWPAGESGRPEDLARLELSQETGLRARVLVKLGYLHSSHGTSNQGGYYFLASGLEPGPAERESEEQDMCQAWFGRTRFEQMIGEGLITDDSTLAAYALLLISERQQG